VQVSLLSSGYIDSMLETHILLTKTDNKILIENEKRTYLFMKDAIKNGFNGNKDYRPRFYSGFISVKSSANSILNEADNEIDVIERMTDVRDKMVEIFKNNDISTFPIDEYSMASLIRELFSYQTIRNISMDSDDLLNNHLSSAMHDGEGWIYSPIDSNVIEMQEKNFAQVYTLKSVPDYVQPWDIAQIIRELSSGRESIPQLTQKFWLTINTRIKDKKEDLNNLNTDLMGLKRQKKLKGVEEKIEIKEKIYEDLTRYNSSRHETIVTMIVYSNDEIERLSQIATRTEARFSDYGYILQKEKQLNFDLFYFSLPFSTPYADANFDFLRRSHLLKNTVISAITPFYGDWSGNTNNPIMMFISRSGQPIGFDFFDPSALSPSGVIIAPMGSGKSFLANYVVLEYFRVGAKIFTVDVGYSYKKTCQILEQNYFEIDKNRNLTLNPFRGLSLDDYYGVNSVEDDKEFGRGISFARQQLFSFFKYLVSPNEELQPGLSGLLEQALAELIEKNKKRINLITMEEVQEVFREIDKKKNTDLGDRIIPYTAGHSLGDFFRNGPEMKPFIFDKQLNGIEIPKVEQSGNVLTTAIALSVIGQIASYAYNPKNKAEMKILLWDEWVTVSHNPHFIPLADRMIRQGRKYNLAFFPISQAFEDTYVQYGSMEGKLDSMMEYKFVLSPNREEMERLSKQNKMIFPEYMMNLAENVHTVQGEYSEILLITKRGVIVMRLIVSYYMRMLFYTTPKDDAIIEKYQKSGMELKDAIAAAVEEKYKGRV